MIVLRYAVFLCLLQKIVIQTVFRTYLYMCHGKLADAVFTHDCVYFLRNSEGMVPLPNSMDEAEVELPAYFEMGILNNNSLIMLEQIITQVRWISYL